VQYAALTNLVSGVLLATLQFPLGTILSSNKLSKSSRPKLACSLNVIPVVRFWMYAERVFRVDKHHGDGTYDSPYGGKSYPLEWYARRNTNPNEFVSDVAFALYPTVFPQYSNTYFLRNIMKDEPTVMNRAADCTEDCANAPTIAPTTAPSTTAPTTTAPTTTAPPTAVAPTAGGGAYSSGAGKEHLTVLHLMTASFALAVARFL